MTFDTAFERSHGPNTTTSNSEQTLEPYWAEFLKRWNERYPTTPLYDTESAKFYVQRAVRFILTDSIDIDAPVIWPTRVSANVVAPTVDEDVHDWLKEQCSRLMYGQCSTLSCLRRGGYKPSGDRTADYVSRINLATCEAYEIKQALRPAIVSAVAPVEQLLPIEIEELEDVLESSNPVFRQRIMNAVRNAAAPLAARQDEAQLSLLSRAVGICEDLAEHVAQELTEQSDDPQRDILNYDDYRKGQIQAAVEIREALERLTTEEGAG